MSPFATMRTGQKRTTAETRGALSRAARSGWWTAQFLGTASAKTKMTTISKTVAATTPHAPNHRTARMPTRVATTNWQMSTSRRTGLRKPWGSSVRRTSTLAPRLPSSARLLALARDIRTRAVSARASRAGGDQQYHDDARQDHVLGRERGGRRHVGGSSSGAAR